MNAVTEQSSAWIRRFQPAPAAGTRLVCFPHAGGSATFYLPVARSLAPAVDVLAIQYPGRQDRRTEPGIDDLHQLADLVAEELRAWQDRPVVYFGHSMGATLAFEVARRLQPEGLGPTALVASGRRAPSCYRPGAVHLGDDAHVVAELRKLSGTAGNLLDDDEVLQMIMPALRSDYRAVETYRYQPGPALSCPILMLTGDSDPEVTPAEARAWAVHTTAGFELQTFPGGHFYLNEQAPAVLAAMADYLHPESA
ncbi:thioesterase [Natronosporangium hydrolyticum]|uniref:Thioesterase n=1 Tax=Natronosporangium hydrolyticum TaxID=2811111 RepID=A0A895YMU1_9ACTN|nr:alpha/beta fold hydrolase [Natronosporangium hydrolyticum]QSB16006.1 thioesterase [Natronosporangium hydrolyticum]